MKKEDLPNFPLLFETIAEFLRDAKVPKSQLRKLADSRRALDTITRVFYSRQAKAYPCGARPRISPMPFSLARPCLGQKPYLPPIPASRVAK